MVQAYGFTPTHTEYCIVFSIKNSQLPKTINMKLYWLVSKVWLHLSALWLQCSFQNAWNCLIESWNYRENLAWLSNKNKAYNSNVCSNFFQHFIFRFSVPEAKCFEFWDADCRVWKLLGSWWTTMHSTLNLQCGTLFIFRQWRFGNVPLNTRLLESGASETFLGCCLGPAMTLSSCSTPFWLESDLEMCPYCFHQYSRPKKMQIFLNSTWNAVCFIS